MATCCICEEEYDLKERKPLLLPCSHTFCRRCLQKMQARKDKLCPVCRRSWASQSVDKLPLIRQLADSPYEVKFKTQVQLSMRDNTCAVHNITSIAWCKTCKVTICYKCFQVGHQLCDWVSIEENTSKLFSTLQEAVTFTRANVIEKFTQITMKNNSVLNDIRENI